MDSSNGCYEWNYDKEQEKYDKIATPPIDMIIYNGLLLGIVQVVPAVIG